MAGGEADAWAETRAAVLAAERLAEVPSSDKEPFANKYKARTALEEHRQVLLAYGGDAIEPESRPLWLQRLLAVVEQRLGLNFLDCEENSEGERRLVAAVNTLSTTACVHLFLSLVQDALNHIGVLWASRDDHTKALETLCRSRELYEQHKDKVTDESWDPPTRCDALYTLTMFYLAQVYGHVGDSEQSAQCCIVTLQRQLTAGDCDRQEWSNNCMHLSTYFVNNGEYGRARHCLQAAARMLPTHAQEPAHANLNIAWGQLYLARLVHGAKEFREKVLRGEDPTELDASPETPTSVVEPEPVSTGEALFPDSGADPVEKLPPVADFDSARTLFKRAMQKLEIAKQYYVLDGYVTKHVGIVTDQSALYRQLAIFERDGERKVKMHRRRVSFLQPLTEALNPSAFDQLWKDVTYELGQTYSEIIELKLAMAEHDESGQTRPPSVKKLSTLVQSACLHLDQFLSSFRWLQSAFQSQRPLSKEEEEAITESEESGLLQWYMTAQFLKARLLGKVETAYFQNKSLDTYTGLVNFSKHTHPSVMCDEIRIATEMASLLPQKIQRLAKQ